MWVFAGLAVGDAATAHQVATANGGVSTLEPQEVSEKVSGYKAVLSEVKAYGDVVLRFVSGTCHEHRLPGFVAVQPEGPTFGLQQLDHCAGNVPNLWEVADHLKAITGVLLTSVSRSAWLRRRSHVCPAVLRKVCWNQRQLHVCVVSQQLTPQTSVPLLQQPV